MTTDDRTPPDDRTPSDVSGERPPSRELPEPPDITRVHELRRRLRQDKAGRSGGGPRRSSLPDKDEVGRRARDIGMFTIIPMMMVVGPALGYLAGLFIENRFGGKPWPTVVGLMWGLAAAFRQIYLLLKRKAEEDQRRRG
jgi:F0F1-type ATP synthase assembly protein I